MVVYRGVPIHLIGARQATAVALALTAVCGWAAAAHSETAWSPSQPIEIVVPSKPGGGLDVTARSIQSVLQDNKMVSVPVVVVNKPGGSGTVGLVYLSDHSGDAHFVSVQAPPMLTNAIVGLSTIGEKDITPLAQLLDEEIIFSVAANSRFHTGRDLAEALRTDPNSVSIGISSSRGAHSHIAAALLMKALGGDPKTLKIVVLGSGAEAATAVLGGHIDVAVTPASSILGQKAAGTIRVLGIPAEKRLGGALADVPTWREQGIDVVFSNWRYVVGPKDLAPEQIAFWDKTLAALVQTPEWHKRAERNFWTVDYKNSAELRQFLAEQRERLHDILSELGMAK